MSTCETTLYCPPLLSFQFSVWKHWCFIPPLPFIHPLSKHSSSSWWIELALFIRNASILLQNCNDRIHAHFSSDSYLFLYHYILGELGREMTPLSIHCRRESLWCGPLSGWTSPKPWAPSPEFARSRTCRQARPTLELCSLAQLLQRKGHGHECNSFFHSVTDALGAISLAFQIR